MRLIGKLFFGAVALILLFAFWLTGSPPAVSIFWQTRDVMIINHDTREVDTGWGLSVRTLPLAEGEIGDLDRPTIFLKIPDQAENRDVVIARWPVGMTLRARISPRGQIGYPADETPYFLYPAAVLTLLLLILAATRLSPLLSGRWQKGGGAIVRGNAGGSFRLIALMFGAVFLVVPLTLFYHFWTFGDPPPYSIVWPRQEMRVVSSTVRPFRVGNGTMAAYLDVVVNHPEAINPNGALLRGVTYSSVSIPDATELAEQYPPGGAVKTMRSIDGDYYVVRWRFPDFLAILIIPLSLFMFPVGVFALRLALL